MDPQFIATVITTAAAALAAGAQDGIKETAKSALVDGYEHGLKPLLRRKFGAQTTVMESIAKVEVNPALPAAQDSLVKDLTAVQAQNDREVVAAANQLQQTFNNYGIHLVVVGSSFRNAPFIVTQGQSPYSPPGYSPIQRPPARIRWSVILAVFLSALVMASVAIYLADMPNNSMIAGITGISLLLSIGLGITAFILFMARIIRGH